MGQLSRAQDIVDQILSSERYANSRAFSERVYRDEPILRTGSRAFGGAQNQAPRSARANVGTTRSGGQSAPTPQGVSSRFRRMHRLAKSRSGAGWFLSSDGMRTFYEQGKFMEDFEDDFAGKVAPERYYPTYEQLSDYELRCYFTWRTKLRSGEAPPACLTFLFLHAYELLCGIGVEPGEAAFAQLTRFFELYAGASHSFDSLLARWRHDYVVFYGLDKNLLASSSTVGALFSYEAVMTLRHAEAALLHLGATEWPKRVPQGCPDAEEVLDALVALSRYRADRSRFVRDHRADVADVAAHVFCRMVAHCHKRRKTDYVDGLFGAPERVLYNMFPSAVFWTQDTHHDVTYVVSDAESYECESGFWWRTYPCRRMEKSRELGTLMHAIDARMRVALGDSHVLKDKPIPKYQGKFVDEEIARLVERLKAEEAARIVIDRSSLVGIRSAAARTREALLTDEEREEPQSTRSVPAAVVAPPAEAAHGEVPSPGAASLAPALTPQQRSVLLALLDGEAPAGDALSMSLATDAINEAFLDVVGDTVIEFDGDAPALVEDYVEDVRGILGL